MKGNGVKTENEMVMAFKPGLMVNGMKVSGGRT